DAFVFGLFGSPYTGNKLQRGKQPALHAGLELVELFVGNLNPLADDVSDARDAERSLHGLGISRVQIALQLPGERLQILPRVRRHLGHALVSSGRRFGWDGFGCWLVFFRTGDQARYREGNRAYRAGESSHRIRKLRDLPGCVDSDRNLSTASSQVAYGVESGVRPGLAEKKKSRSLNCDLECLGSDLNI